MGDQMSNIHLNDIDIHYKQKTEVKETYFSHATDCVEIRLSIEIVRVIRTMKNDWSMLLEYQETELRFH